MASKTRVPNKVIWGLEDMMAVLTEARADWQPIMERAERTMDIKLALAAGRMRDHLAELERLARAARQGEYAGGKGQ